MPTRVPATLRPPLAFAHRGARAHAPENTVEAFTLALRLGATGLESDVWVTADGEAVLDHDGLVGTRPRRRPIAALARADLPAHVPTLGDLYAACGTGMALSLDVKDAAAFEPVVAVARAAARRSATCGCAIPAGSRWPSGGRVRRRAAGRLDARGRIEEGPERRAASLAAAGIDAVNMHQMDWTGGLTTLFHRFGVLAFAWGAQSPRVLAELIDAGIDGVYSDHVDRMVDAVTAAYPAP